MAEAKLVNILDTVKWEPFMQITLSKREAAAITALLGSSSEDLGIGLYDVMSSFFKDNVHSYLIQCDGTCELARVLNKEYGEV